MGKQKQFNMKGFGTVSSNLVKNVYVESSAIKKISKTISDRQKNKKGEINNQVSKS